MAKGKYQKWLEPENLTLIEGWARDGLTDEQIAKDKMHIAPTTLYDWINKYPKISKAMSLGKEVVDYEVESALKKRAEGYDIWEETEVWNQELGEWVPATRKKKHVPADTSATSMWLRNRRPDKWRDKPVVQEAEYEDDGLISALKGDADHLFESGDDSEMVSTNE